MADLEKIVEQLSGLTVLEAAELVKKLEEKWGVSAAAPVAVAAAAGAAPGLSAGAGMQPVEHGMGTPHGAGHHSVAEKILFRGITHGTLFRPDGNLCNNSYFKIFRSEGGPEHAGNGHLSCE